jgi:hypothetical protein
MVGKRKDFIKTEKVSRYYSLDKRFAYSYNEHNDYFGTKHTVIILLLVYNGHKKAFVLGEL